MVFQVGNVIKKMDNPFVSKETLKGRREQGRVQQKSKVNPNIRPQREVLPQVKLNPKYAAERERQRQERAQIRAKAEAEPDFSDLFFSPIKVVPFKNDSTAVAIRDLLGDFELVRQILPKSEPETNRHFDFKNILEVSKRAKMLERNPKSTLGMAKVITDLTPPRTPTLPKGKVVEKSTSENGISVSNATLKEMLKEMQSVSKPLTRIKSPVKRIRSQQDIPSFHNSSHSRKRIRIAPPRNS